MKPPHEIATAIAKDCVEYVFAAMIVCNKREGQEQAIGAYIQGRISNALMDNSSLKRQELLEKGSVWWGTRSGSEVTVCCYENKKGADDSLEGDGTGMEVEELFVCPVAELLK